MAVLATPMRRLPAPRLTVLAPHADDAALSLGASLQRLAQAGVALTVVTCHTRSAWAPHHPRAREAEAVTRVRRREDARYAQLLGARLIELGLDEAALRRPGLLVQRPTDGADRAHGRALARALACALADERSDGGALMLVPLGIGEHVDHALTRTAGLERARRRPLAFYEDLPYAAWEGWPGVRAKVRAAERLIGRRLHPLRLTTRFARARQRAAACYPSQLSSRERRALEAVVRARGGELLWATRRMHAALLQLAGSA